MIPEPQHAVDLNGVHFEVGDVKAIIQNAFDQAMQHIGGSVAVITSLNGAMIESVDGHYVRLVNFIPGVPLAEFRPHSSELLGNGRPALWSSICVCQMR